jgi:hypothetical protein
MLGPLDRIVGLNTLLIGRVLSAMGCDRTLGRGNTSLASILHWPVRAVLAIKRAWLRRLLNFRHVCSFAEATAPRLARSPDWVCKSPPLFEAGFLSR